MSPRLRLGSDNIMRLLEVQSVESLVAGLIILGLGPWCFRAKAVATIHR